MDNGLSNPILTFGERLEYLMKNDGINIMEKGANIELSKRLYAKGALHYSGEDYDTKNKNRNSARKRIEEHRKADSASNVSGYWLKAYCDYFRCSADYLFGYIELPTHEKTNIQRETGLSEKSIQQLHKLTTYAIGKERLTIIDHFLSNIRFTLGLTDRIRDCYNKYAKCKKGKEIYDREQREIGNLTNGDLVQEIILINSGKCKKTINTRMLEEWNDSRDATRFKVQKAFDDVLENFMKDRYEKTPDTE